MRLVWGALVVLLLAGCSKPAPPTPSPSAAASASQEAPKTAAQQAQEARNQAAQLYKQKAWAKARAQALIAAGLMKLDGTDNTAMKLLAAKAGTHAKDPAAYKELRELAADNKLDAEGKQLLGTLPPEPHAAAPPPAPPPHVVEVPPTQTAQPGGNSDVNAANDATQILKSHRSWQGQ